jgi:hypothetical protein
LGAFVPLQLQIKPTLIGIPVACSDVDALTEAPLALGPVEESSLLAEDTPLATTRPSVHTTEKGFPSVFTWMTVYPWSDDIFSRQGSQTEVHLPGWIGE